MTGVDVVSHYRVIQKLTSGGMADIYLAEDLNLPRAVALKVLPNDRRGDESLQGRLMREAKAASSLSHPNIARIYDAGRDNGSLFIAMEYIDGETLEQRITRESLSIDFITAVGIQLASALEEAHSHGIIHRDIKCANVMLTRRDEVKVLDFGLAKFLSPDLETSDTTRQLTEAGFVLGTVPYMSPEQVRGEVADPRSDIFAFGVVMYHLITRRLPFDGANVNETFDRIKSAQPESMARYNYDLPAELERIVRKCLEKDRARRYQSAAELVVDLRNFERDRQLSFEPHDHAATLEMRVNRRRSLIWAVFLLMVAVGVGFIMWKGQQAKAARFRSIAVLPFENRGAGEFEYVSENLSDIVISDLARAGLRVMARSTSARFAGKTPVEAGRALHVDAVLSGRVTSSGNHIVVATELVSARDGSLIAGDRLERPASDVPTLAATIAGGVVRSLGIDEPPAAAGVGASEEAYRLYLQGRQEWNKRTPDGLRSSLELFRQAVEISPDFAPAYAGLADTYSLLERYTHVPNSQSRERAITAAQRAVQLDPNLPEAHASLASVRDTYEWDWRGAEDEYRQAVSLSPSYATAHHWYAMLLARMGRFDEALQEIKTARELDPLSPVIFAAKANIDYYRGDYQSSMDAARATLQLSPDFFVARFQLASSMTMAGDPAGALRELAPLHGASADVGAAEAIAHARMGDAAAARAFINDLESSGKTDGVEYTIAAVCAALGDHSCAMAWLNKAYVNRSFWIGYLAVEPVFAPMRRDPEFAELLRKVGLPAHG